MVMSVVTVMSAMVTVTVAQRPAPARAKKWRGR